LINVGLLTIKLFLTQDFYVSADNESRSTSLACTSIMEITKSAR